MSDLIGRRFRSYEIIRELGKGGMAVVYLGRQISMDRQVAIKVIASLYSSDPDFRARFDQEARTIARLEHPHILPVIDYGEEDFGAFLVMRYVEGGTLETRLQKGALSFAAAHEMLAKIASALDYAHSQGVVHRDLKPANILLDDHDNPYLTDFGIAKILESTQHLTKTGAAVGTPAYMAPEQWKAETVGPYTDQYSLGVVLYEMVTGGPPFTADTTFGYMHKHIYEPPPPPSLALHNLPAPAEEVILRALAKKPEERFPSTRAMSDAFGAGLAKRVEKAEQPLNEEERTVVVAPSAVPDTVEAAPAPPTARREPSPPPPGGPRPGGPAPSRALGVGRSRRGMFVIGAVLVVALVMLAALLAGGVLLGGGRASDTPTSTPTSERLEVAAAATSTATEHLPMEAAVAPTSTPLLVTSTPGGEGGGALEPGAVAQTATALAVILGGATETLPPAAIAGGPTLTSTRAPTATRTPTSTPTATPTASQTPDWTATADAGLLATSQRVMHDLTATANAAIINLATGQAAQTGTAIAVASFTWTPTPTPTATFTWTPSPTWTATWTPSSTLTATWTPTATPTATFTLTPSSTPTATWTLTATPTATFTRTPTSTPTPTATWMPSPTATPTYTLPPTWTPPPTMPPLPTWTPVPPESVIHSCPGMLPSRLRPGDLAVVSAEDPRPINVRRDPGLRGTRLGQFEVGMVLIVLEGPVCADEHPWFRVRRQGGMLAGWVAESGEGVYYIEPVTAQPPAVQNCPGVMPTRLQINAAAVVDTPTNLPLRMHEVPGSGTPVTALIPDGTPVTIIDGMLCMDGYSWWRYRTPDGQVGWSSEADNDSYFLAPLP